MKINIISCDNGVGLTRDAKIMTDLLAASGHQVSFSPYTQQPSGERYDVNIFAELVNPAWIPSAAKNVLVPNPEWYDNGWVQYLPRFDLILAKTRAAQETFAKRNLPVTYTSFTSPDRNVDGVPKNDLKFLHLAGKSLQKGTEMVIRTWEKNPSFPPLTVVQDPGKWRRRVTCRNVTMMYDRIDEYVLLTLQNAYGVHVCPSETEGFGHYIMEAMSARAIVISTNAPPMNELVTADRGVLAEPVRRSPQRLAMNYYVAETTLERAVRTVMSLGEPMKERMRANGRRFYEENDAFFRASFVDAINKLV